jgi:hypothetical protein
MRRPLLLAAMTIAIASVACLNASPGQATDLNVTNRHVARSYCGPYGCRPYRVVNRCPTDRLSCYPLYGAYGPSEYGGAGYWGAYSYR